MNKKITIILLLINLMTMNKVYAGTFPNPPVEGPFIGDIIAKKIHSAVARWKHDRQLKNKHKKEIEEQANEKKELIKDDHSDKK